MGDKAVAFSPPVVTHTDSPAYLEHLEQYLGSMKSTDALYQSLWHAHTDTERFEAFLDVAETYRPLSGAAILDSGSGTGGLLLASQKRGPCRLVGIEVEPQIYRLERFHNQCTG
ncbi:MAG: hypothetical protein LC776_16560 [Acidobacteria bacterium]|nr:hypothetical protein [Acidobacteriota bacterium]